MELVSLRYLLDVIEAGSFAKAAAKLGVKASTLTRRVTALEDELGVTLVERRRSGIRLTSGGAAVTVEIRRMLADLELVTRQPAATEPAKQVGFDWACACHRLANH